jgi:glycosyltransferase involved in cell wall biosynthesis
MTGRHATADVSAVVCTLNSISGIERCLLSLRQAGVSELIVVDAGSTDGTREIAETLADEVLDDPGIGLGNARNIGIAQTTGSLVLNMGSDNVMPPGELDRMIDTLDRLGVQGVSARTRIDGPDYLSQGLNAWREGRFRPGPAAVIGTPTLFIGELLRADPYDPARRFSDDSELCERWARDHGARFAISDATVLEVGKTSWDEIVVRCRMYGISDEEVFRMGRGEGWSVPRQVRSLLHPGRADFVEPTIRLARDHGPVEAAMRAPFLAAFAAMRYGFWARSAADRLIGEHR